MKLYMLAPPLSAHKYAAEQMMLTLFPGQHPEYPETPPQPGEDSAAFSLEDNAVTARVVWEGREALGRSPFQAPSYRELAGALKLAFYQAGTALLGRELPWGALTGVRPVKLPTRDLREGFSPKQAQARLQERYHVSPMRAQMAVDCAQASRAAELSLAPDQVSVYVGIPFCPTRCAYCSFVSADVGKTLKLVDPYVELLLEELDAAAAVLRRLGLQVRSFYMGGGTPTVLSAPQLDRVLSACREKLPLAACTEYTVEAGRPDTITQEKLKVLKACGVGRISINPQTLEDQVLEAIGRRHSSQDIIEAFELARATGFDCINMDLIAGLPQDNFYGFYASLVRVLELEPENVTIHTLALKKGSRLMEDGSALPCGEETAAMLDFSIEALHGNGFRPYYLYRQKYMSGALENVGWTQPGRESLYNIVMMEELQSVLSLGAGGVTKLIRPGGQEILRLANPKYPQDYLSAREKILGQKAELSAFFQGQEAL